MGAGLHQFDFREDPPPPRKSTEKGLLPSAMLGYRYENGVSEPIFSARMEGSIAVPTQYEGTDQSGKNPMTDSTQNRFLELEADLSTPGWQLASATELRGYAGAGYRYWQRGNEATDSGAYREDYQWPLGIAGALLRTRPTERFGLDLDLSARWQFLGTMKVFLSEMNGALQDTTVNLGSRMGFKAQLPLSYRIYRKTSLLLSPWAEYSAIGESEKVAILSSAGKETGFLLDEPSSRTIQYGSMLGVSIGL
jgi:hypothetical protein